MYFPVGTPAVLPNVRKAAAVPFYLICSGLNLKSEQRVAVRQTKPWHILRNEEPAVNGGLAVGLEKSPFV
jgi:hypothetical protein